MFRIYFLLALALITGCATGSGRRFKVMERQLTAGPGNKILDHHHNISPDGKLIAFDTRGEAKDIAHNERIQTLDLSNLEVTTVYQTPPGNPGVGAASFLDNEHLIVVSSLKDGSAFEPTARGGLIISLAAAEAGKTEWLDARDIMAPYTPGALRGGTHRYDPDFEGQWVGFEYNDTLMKKNGTDLRNIGVAKRGSPVKVLTEPGNHSGVAFSVLLSKSVPQPVAGSDEYRDASHDCWIGDHSHTSRAFLGEVNSGGGKFFNDVFMVMIPDFLNQDVHSEKLEGHENTFPGNPAGTKVFRLTRTAENPDERLRGVSGQLRASPDGKWIAYQAPAIDANGHVLKQIFVVSQLSRRIRQISNSPIGVDGNLRFTPDGRYVLSPMNNGSLGRWTMAEPEPTEGVAITEPSSAMIEGLVIMPNSKLAVYNRRIDGVMQIFSAEIFNE